MVILRCKMLAKIDNLQELKEFINSQKGNDVLVVPNYVEVIYTDSPDAEFVEDDENPYIVKQPADEKASTDKFRDIIGNTYKI